MVLTYTVTEIVTRTRVEKLEVPTTWGMFSKYGNAKLTKIAKRAYNQAEARKLGIREVLIRYVAAWERICNSKDKRLIEASDTAVREAIGEFHDQLYHAVEGTRPSAQLWEDTRQAVYAREIAKETTRRKRVAARKAPPSTTGRK